MNEKEARKRLFDCLDVYLSVSQKKFDVNNKRDVERRAWARIGLQTINAYGKLLESVQIDTLMKEIEAIKKELKMK